MLSRIASRALSSKVVLSRAIRAFATNKPLATDAWPSNEKTVILPHGFGGYKIPAPQMSTRPSAPFEIAIPKFPQQAITSIIHRISGLVLSIGFAGIGTLALFGSANVSIYWEYFYLHYPALMYLAKLAIAFPLILHFTNGIRHMLWDANPEWMNSCNALNKHALAALVFASIIAFFLIFFC
eukprot:TRINITY_DN8784_c0_g1_i1.p1 TRINITY_DN8784_c0_g1~~TRINITY_DN8784_c0_g1_i1.p1  ORF type:complete len:182 (-),score=34.87 TRINITY_DN8784_c0_g1_i1:81-626(-)